MISIIGLGTGNIEDLTLGSYKALKESKIILLRTKNHPIVKKLKDNFRVTKSYDREFENTDEEELFCEKILEDIISYNKQAGDVVYGIPENPLSGDKVVKLITSFCDRNNIEYKVFPSITTEKKDKIYSKNYFPKECKKRTIDDLISLVETLRGETGCPWDMEQNHESIKNELLEETYELIEAIDKKDTEGMIEELGDVLFHIIFHCSIGKTDNQFDINDVIERNIDKMVYRHPHVFGRKSVKDSDEVLRNWDDIKKIEKNYETITEEMKAVAKTLPSLIRAHKVQKKAAKVGFDWDNLDDAAEKVKEELLEVLDVYKSNNKEKIKDEVGDLLFACINVARKLEINGEEAVNSTINKFINRFSFIEESLQKEGKKMNEVSLEYMDNLWLKAKNIENNKK